MAVSEPQQRLIIFIVLGAIAGSGASLSVNNTISQEDLRQLAQDETLQRQIDVEKSEQGIREWVQSLLTSSIRERDQLRADVIELRHELADARERVAALESGLKCQ